jgi:hypothetical protein
VNNNSYGICEVDQRPIIVQIYKGTGVCGELCRKFRNKEMSLETYNKQKGDLKK